MIGCDEDKKTVYLIDFGLAKSYLLNTKDRTHIPFREHVGMVGTSRYASVFAHMGKANSNIYFNNKLNSCKNK